MVGHVVDEITRARRETLVADRVLETLESLVKLEMVADVPLGCSFPGGWIRHPIVALMMRHSNGQSVSTYTVGIAAADITYDMCRTTGLGPVVSCFCKPISRDHFEADCDAGLQKSFPTLMNHRDPAMLASFLISQAARETLRVMLSGMGGDEVFAGYPRHMAMKLAGALDPAPGFLRRPLMKLIADTVPGGLPGKLTAPLRNAKKFARSAALDFEDRTLVSPGIT